MDILLLDAPFPLPLPAKADWVNKERRRKKVSFIFDQTVLNSSVEAEEEDIFFIAAIFNCEEIVWLVTVNLRRMRLEEGKYKKSHIIASTFFRPNRHLLRLHTQINILQK